MLAENIKASPASLHRRRKTKKNKKRVGNYKSILIKLQTGPKSQN
jgi:hypothetical protein